jgi:hypothetical protein
MGTNDPMLEPSLITVTLTLLDDASGGDVTDKWLNLTQEYLKTAWMYSESKVEIGKVLGVVTVFIEGHASQEKQVDGIVLADVLGLKKKAMGEAE